MKSIVMIGAAVLLAGFIQGDRPATHSAAAPPPDKAEARLAEALAGRTAGPAQDCVRESELGTQESYGRHAILFRGRSDDVVYVNRPPAGCPIIGPGQAIKVQTPSPRLCRGDVVSVFDPVSGMGIGGCALGPFTPYRRNAPSK